jgi:hypothetical protein
LSYSAESGDIPEDDEEIIVVEEDIQIDREKINEMRRAYLEEARSQEAVD